MNNDTLKQNYETACNAYLKTFCKKHGYNYDIAAVSWIANDIGGVCMLGDFFIPFGDMKTDLDNDAPKDEYWSYYDYSLQAHELGFNCPNYANWLRGCPRLSEEQIKSVREAKNRVYEAEEEFERILKKENDEIAGEF